MQDCYYERDTEMGDSEEQDSGNNHLNEPRTGMSVDENLWRNGSFQSWKAPGIRALFSYCAGMKIISEVKFQIYQKSSMANRET